MSQSKLLDFSAPQTVLPVFDCGNCLNQKGYEAAKVRCMGELKAIPANGCPSYSDGKELEYMDRGRPPAVFRAKKWGGRA